MSLALTQENLLHSGIRKFPAITDRSNNSKNSFSGCTNRAYQSSGDSVTFTGVAGAGNKAIKPVERIITALTFLSELPGKALAEGEAHIVKAGGTLSKGVTITKEQMLHMTDNGAKETATATLAHNTNSVDLTGIISDKSGNTISLTEAGERSKLLNGIVPKNGGEMSINGVGSPPVNTSNTSDVSNLSNLSQGNTSNVSDSNWGTQLHQQWNQHPELQQYLDQLQQYRNELQQHCEGFIQWAHPQWLPLPGADHVQPILQAIDHASNLQFAAAVVLLVILKGKLKK